MTRKQVTKKKEKKVDWTVEPVVVSRAQVGHLPPSEVVALLAAAYQRIRALEIQMSSREIRSRRLIG